MVAAATAATPTMAECVVLLRRRRLGGEESRGEKEARHESLEMSHFARPKLFPLGDDGRTPGQETLVQLSFPASIVVVAS
jgi:hypothetical protein